MRALKILVVVMGVLIVVGVGVLVVAIVQRGSGGASLVPSVGIDEPAGTHIVGSSLSGDRVALQLQGGGPDRVVIVDLRSGHVLGRAGLTK